MVKHLLVVAASIACLAFCGAANAGLIEDFDGGGNTTYATTGIATLVSGAPGNGQAMRVARLQGGGWGTVAWDERADATGFAPGIALEYDFRMTDDAANAAAGGCCGQAADGIGIGLFDTATYGATGASSPGGANWERPSFANAFTIGFDIYQNDDINLNWNGAQVIATPFPFVLNDNNWHRAEVTVWPSGGNASVDLTIVEDVNGSPVRHSVFTRQSVTGMDLSNLFNYRLIAGARTGGAWHDGELDNLVLSEIPEPSTAIVFGLLGLCGLALFARRRTG
jgi:hypothetical protein